MNETFQKLYEAGYTNPASEHYVWLPELEWLSPEKQHYYHETLYPELKNVVPFAINGSGDFYGFYPSAEDVQAVIFVSHESERGQLYAPSIEAAIFRHIVEFASGCYAETCLDEEKILMDEDEAEDYISESEAVELMRSYSDTYGQFLPDAWRGHLAEMAEKGFMDFNTFISMIDSVELICEAIGEHDATRLYPREQLRGE